MNREEAANYLGISTRTLDRYREQGILPVRYIKGRTRRTPVYDTADLDALKTRLDPASGISAPEDTPRAPAPEEARPTSASESLGFRLDPVARQRVAEAGAALGMSAGEYARYLVLMGLERREDDGDEEDASSTRQLLREQGLLLQDIVTQLEQHEGPSNSVEDTLKSAQRQQERLWQQARQDLDLCVRSIAELSQQMEALAQSVTDVRGRIAVYATPKTLTLPSEFALLPEQLTQIGESLALIREDIRTVAAGILATCARPGEFGDDVQEIEQWVTTNLPA